MEQILTNKKIVERNLSIVKHINDKYVLFKDEKKITVDDGKPNVSSVYGVTTIDQLMSVSSDDAVPEHIIISNDPKKEPYVVKLIPTEDLERIKKGLFHLSYYDFPYHFDDNADNTDMVYVLVRTFDFTLRDMNEKLIQQPISLTYIDNVQYDLDKVLEIIKANPSRFKTVCGADASYIKIDGDEDENEDEYNIKFITCKYLPNEDEYNEFFYSNIYSYYSWFDKILDKWFSKCKKEVTD